MRITTRIVVCIAISAVVADTPLLGQRQGGPSPAGRQGGPPDGGGRGRAGGPQGGRGETPRDRPQARTGTASIRGRVINLTTGTPVRRASIQASYLAEQGRGEVERGGRTTNTDDNGVFELTGLAAGRWTLRASKTGYVEQQFGQRSAFASADPITLTDGQRFAADFRLSRGGAIGGRILDEFGDPLAGANVTAMRLQTTAQGSRTVRTGTSVPSDDTGAYRIYGLPPGQYYVAVNDPSAARIVVLTSPDGSSELQLNGGSTDTPVAAERITFTGNVSFSDNETRRTSYAPTYYPGTANITEAQKLTLGLGEEQSGISLTIVPVKAARITGKVMGSNGMPMRAQVNLMSAMGQGFTPSGGRNGTANDGTFTLTNIPPGTYTLNVLGPNIGAVPPEVASMPLVVNGEDIVGLTIATGSGASIQGMIVADNGSRLPTSSVTVEAVPLQSGSATWAPRDAADENGTFVLEGLLGAYSLRVQSLPSGWIVKSVAANGLDVSDAAMEFRPGDRVTVRVELTDRVTQVSGSVRPNRDVRSGTVVVFADEPAKWTGLSRFVKTARIGEDGRFSINGLPPHQRYIAIAIDYVEQGEATNPEFLQRAKGVANTSFALSAGGQQVLDLPLIVR